MKHQRRNKKNGSHNPQASANAVPHTSKGKEKALAKLTWVGLGYTNGNRGAARAKAGFKKAIRTAVRRDGKRQVQDELSGVSG